VILTLRADHLSSHAGQVSFPGGRADEGDASPVETALREAQEEIGLDPEKVTALGLLEPYRTRSGYRIFPVLALVSEDIALVPHEAEVADVFEVPLAFLMDEANHLRESRMWQGRERYFYAMPFEERYIWGATAGILRIMYERLYAA
jgi:8-oxo-dGTP pyrophosphatase MutT (NUDIX family)